MHRATSSLVALAVRVGVMMEILVALAVLAAAMPREHKGEVERKDLQPKAHDYPRAAAWYARVCARPAWQQVAEAEAAFKWPD